MPENQNFYIIQHGIRWTGMPAWNKTLNDDADLAAGDFSEQHAKTSAGGAEGIGAAGGCRRCQPLRRRPCAANDANGTEAGPDEKQSRRAALSPAKI